MQHGGQGHTTKGTSLISSALTFLSSTALRSTRRKMFLAHHFPVYCQLSSPCPLAPPTLPMRNFKKANWSRFREVLAKGADAVLRMLPDDVQVQLDHLQRKLAADPCVSALTALV